MTAAGIFLRPRVLVGIGLGGFGETAAPDVEQGCLKVGGADESRVIARANSELLVL